ncbi:protein rep, partial [Escherichia coli]|nr:protein rep [Escherichia coli]
PKIVADYTDHRCMFPTLTIRNCDIAELGDTLTAMNAALQGMKDRKELKQVQGWIRTKEVKRGRDGKEHPHFNNKMMVPTTMLSGRAY